MKSLIHKGALSLSLLLNALLLAVAIFYLSQVGVSKTVAQLKPAERLDYGYYATEHFAPLPPARTVLIGDSTHVNAQGYLALSKELAQYLPAG